MYNAIIFGTLSPLDAERALHHAERILRYSWNLYGFHRIGSGWEAVITDGFGNAYGNERKMRLFSIAIEVPAAMDYRTALVYIDYGLRVVNCEADIRLAEVTQSADEDEDWEADITAEDLAEWQSACVGLV